MPAEEIKAKTFLFLVLLSIIIAMVLDSRDFTDFWIRALLFFILMEIGWATVNVINKESKTN